MIIEKTNFRPKNFVTEFFNIFFRSTRDFVKGYGYYRILSGAQISSGVPRLILDDKNKNDCISCGLCVELCPTDALELTGQRGKSPLHFTLNRSRCISCSECIEICPVHALESTPDDALVTSKELDIDLLVCPDSTTVNLP